MPINLLTATAADLQAQLTHSSVTSETLLQLYLRQVTRHNGYLKAVIAPTPVHLLYRRAAELDIERAKGTVRGPLHGIPILVKDNIDTEPALGLPTTCGSLALVDAKPRKNAVIIDRLLAAGAIILGKANLSEWAYYKSNLANCGWSAVGGQTQSAYVRGGLRDDDSSCGHSSPGGSSSGSAVAVASGFSPIAIGTETMGSLVIPSDRAALYTIKPTIKLVPQGGIIPITCEADSAGPMTKSVQDLADLLDVLVDPAKTTIPEGGYRSAVTRSWGDIRIGVVEPEKWLLPEEELKFEKEAINQMQKEWKAAYEKLKTVVKVVKPVSLIFPAQAAGNIWKAFDSTFEASLEKYLATLDDCEISTLEELIEFNTQHADEELGRGANYNQDRFIKALKANLPTEEYHRLLKSARNACGPQGIDKALDDNELDVILGPGDGTLCVISGIAGYPGATLPLGYLDFNGRPFGFQIIAKAHQEALLIQVQSAWEATFPKRRPPPLEDINPKREADGADLAPRDM